MTRTPEFRRLVTDKLFNNPAWANNEQPATMEPGMGSNESLIGYQVGTRIPGFLEKHPVLKPIGALMENAGTNTLNTALIGAALGSAAGLGHGLVSDSPGRSAAIGAIVGAGGATLLSKIIEMRQRKKYAFYAMGDSNPVQAIQTKLFQDMSLSGSEKSGLMGLVARLGPTEQNNLSSVLRGTIGASIGFVIARYLAGMGMTGSILMSILGGGIGSQASGLPTNAMGQRVNREYDVFGQRRLLF